MLLPSLGRWHLVNPWVAENPPFTVIEVDLVGMRGDAYYYFQSAPLSKVNKLSPSRFGALYQFRGQKGLFEAEAQTDGGLVISFIGTIKTECNAFPVRRRWDVKRVAILTSVGNRHGRLIPGHTAMAIDGTVYSFEFPHFHVKPVKDYFAEPGNRQRAIIVQELNCQKFDASATLDYLRYQVDNNIYFFRHNWCSYQAAMALRNGNAEFEPPGIDTPWEVYNTARKLGLASRTYFIWDPSQTPDDERSRQWDQLSGGGESQYLPSLVQEPWGHVFTGVKPASGPDVRTW